MSDRSRDSVREIEEREQRNIRITRTHKLVLDLLDKLRTSHNLDEQSKAKKIGSIIEGRDKERFWYLVYQNIQKGYEDVGKYSNQKKIDPTQMNTAVRMIEYAAERYDQEQEILKLRVDPLTRLPMRSEFVRNFIEITRNNSYTFFALAVIDVDHLHLVNEQSGHWGGDTYLVHVAEGLQDCVFAKDSVSIPFSQVYRSGQGGDEFYMLIASNNPDAKQGKQELKRLVQNALENATKNSKIDDILVDRRQIQTGLSCGVAFFDKSQKISFDALLNGADQAGFIAKMTTTTALEIRNKPQGPLLPEIREVYNQQSFPQRGQGRWGMTCVDYTVLTKDMLPVIDTTIQKLE